MIRRFSSLTGIPFKDALVSACKVPAEVLRVDNHKGSIKEDYDADIVLFDNDNSVHRTITGGKVVY